MSKKKKYIKYLSQSILLEEGGLPRMNLTIILLIVATVAAFLVWSSMVDMNQVIHVEGITERSDKGPDDFIIKTYVPSAEIGTIEVGADVLFQIKGLTDRKPAEGSVSVINTLPIKRQTGKVEYETEIRISENTLDKKSLEKKLIEGMTVQVDIVNGHKNLLQYLLGPVFDK